MLYNWNTSHTAPIEESSSYSLHLCSALQFNSLKRLTLVTFTPSHTPSYSGGRDNCSSGVTIYTFFQFWNPFRLTVVRFNRGRMCFFFRVDNQCYGQAAKIIVNLDILYGVYCIWHIWCTHATHWPFMVMLVDHTKLFEELYYYY